MPTERLQMPSVLNAPMPRDFLQDYMDWISKGEELYEDELAEYQVGRNPRLVYLYKVLLEAKAKLVELARNDRGRSKYNGMFAVASE